MDNEQFWVAIWKVIGTVLVFLVLTFAGCTSYKTHTVAEAVKGSTNPIAAACAFNAVGSVASNEGILCLKALEK